ncbi:hypothetical protein [uncultured Psychroserpens sp.]|uniref:hypothetical protein n=1 Tax=uncultured Psychroserpens sp. TaxID=255436 RepID=UPI0026136370|nr:hypothetical protein [uncultured Psychroserpens sp.]
MKKILYILLIIGMIACKHDQEMKNQTIDSAPMSVEDEDDYNYDSKAATFEDISTQKFGEYIDLVKLKQDHPQFETDINSQLLSFTEDSLFNLNYPKGFTISDIEKIRNIEMKLDSIEFFTIRFTVNTNTLTFKDSILAKVTSKPDYFEVEEAVSIKKIRFKRFD